jgi:DNA-binding NtrC family response regulator
MAYKLGASSFLVKPFDFQNAVEMAKNITHYWLKMNMTSGPTAGPKEKAAANPENSQIVPGGSSPADAGENDR